MNCERKGCERSCGPSSSLLSARPRAGGFVIVEGRTKEGHVVTMPHEWRCEIHLPPLRPDYDESFIARYMQEFEKRLGYAPPRFRLQDGREATLVAGLSNLSPNQAEKLRSDFDRIGRVVDVQALDVPTDVILVD
jgi:hypothetical protein